MVFFTPRNQYRAGLGLLSGGATGFYPRGQFMQPTNVYSGFGSTRTIVRRRKPRRFGTSNSFARRVRSLAPYKHNTLTDQAVAMTHATIYTRSLTSKIAQGDTNADRDGDAVHLTSLKVKGAISAAAATGAYMYRILIGFSGEEYNVTDTNAGLTFAEIFLPNNGMSFGVNSNINPKAFTVLHDEIIDLNSLIAAAADVKTFAFNVAINQKFPYQATGSVYGKTKNLYMVVIGNVVGGTGGTTAVGSYYINTDLVFQAA